MTSLMFYALLARLDLVGLLVTLWVSIVSVSAGWVLIVMVAVPVFDMMRLAFGLLSRELIPGD